MCLFYIQLGSDSRSIIIKVNHASVVFKKFLKSTKATATLPTNFMKDNALIVHRTVGGSQQD